MSCDITEQRNERHRGDSKNNKVFLMSAPRVCIYCFTEGDTGRVPVDPTGPNTNLTGGKQERVRKRLKVRLLPDLKFCQL